MKPYYSHAGITIYHGDCREILPQLEAGLIVTDPPYGVGKDYGEGSIDNLETFKAAITMIAASGLQAAVIISASRIFDVPVRPQWTGVWNKPYSASGLLSYPIYPHWDAILFYALKGNFLGNNGHRSDVFEFSPTRPDEGHPTPKPTDLMQELIHFLPARGVVLDPFAGSGSTLIAAKLLNRNAIGIEIEEKYCEIAAKRLSQEVLCFTESV